MKKVFYTLCITLLAFSLSAQSVQEKEGIWQTTLDKKKVAKNTNPNQSATRSTSGCSDLLFDQDVGLQSNLGVAHHSVANIPEGQNKGYDDFTLSSAVTIETVMLNMTEFRFFFDPDSECNSPELQINFRADNNGTFGPIIHSRTIPAGAATYTKDGISTTWSSTAWISIYHFPITPVMLPAGTYWLEVYAPQPVLSAFDEGLYWNQANLSPISGASAFTTGPFSSSVGSFAFAFCGEETNPTSFCVPAIEAVCQNTTVALQPGGTASINASDVDGGSSGFTNISVSPSTFDCADLGTNTVTLTVDDGNGNSDDCTATVTVTNDGGLPDSWQGTDIGNVTVGNEYSFDACSSTGDQYEITGSGNNATSYMTDNVAFGSQTLCGDGSITAKIESVDPNGYGGLMIRETTAAGSKQVSIFSNMTNILRHESRSMTNGFKQVQAFYKPAPMWLRLQRQGNWVFAYYSTTGSNFQYVHAVQVSMQSCVEIGLASFTNIPNAQTTAVFSNVSTSGNIITTMEQEVEAEEMASVSRTKSEFGIRNSEGMQGFPTSHFRFPISLFPNPTTADFTLQLEAPLTQEATVQIFNLYGQPVAQQRLAEGQVRQEWNTVDWPAGTYVLKVQRDGQPPLVKQFVVMK